MPQAKALVLKDFETPKLRGRSQVKIFWAPTFVGGLFCFEIVLPRLWEVIFVSILCAHECGRSFAAGICAPTFAGDVFRFHFLLPRSWQVFLILVFTTFLH